MNSLAPLPVVVPLATAAAVLFVEGIVPRTAVRCLTAAAALAEIGLAAVLLHQAGTTIVYWFGGWTPRAGVALGISFTVDQLGAGAALLAGIVTAAAMTTTATIREADGIVHALLLTLLAAMAGFCLTGDLFNLFVFFELMAVSAFALAAYHTGSLAGLRSALNFAITNSIGAFLVLIGSLCSTAAPAPSTWPRSVTSWPVRTGSTGSASSPCRCSSWGSSSRRRSSHFTSGSSTPPPPRPSRW